MRCAEVIYEESSKMTVFYAPRPSICTRVPLEPQVSALFSCLRIFFKNLSDAFVDRLRNKLGVRYRVRTGGAF